MGTGFVRLISSCLILPENIYIYIYTHEEVMEWTRKLHLNNSILSHKTLKLLEWTEYDLKVHFNSLFYEKLKVCLVGKEKKMVIKKQMLHFFHKITTSANRKW